MAKLEQKVSLPTGSCKLASPLWTKGMVGSKNNHCIK